MFKGLSNIEKTCEAILRYSIFALVFLLPVLFLPWTSDFLDFNKQALLVLLVFVALFAWMAKVLISGKFSISLNKTHIVVSVLFLVFLISTIFSQDKHGSFWGWPRITSESFLTLICLVIFYFLVSNVFSKKEIFKLVITLGLSGVLAALVGVMQLLGLFIPFVSIKNASFNTIGLVGNFGIFIAILLPLLIILEIYSKKWLKIIFGIGIVLVGLALVLINYSMVWWVVLVGCALLMPFALIKKQLFDLRWLGLPMFFMVLALFFLILQVQLPVPARGIEVYLNQSTSFDIALKTLKDVPIFGSGPGTFAFDFSKYKNVDFNKTVLWSMRFGGAGSKVLNILATTGILGFISFLSLIAIMLFYGVKFLTSRGFHQEQDLVLAGGILVGFVSQIVGYFLYNSSLSIDFLFFFFIACFIGLVEEEKKEYPLSPSSLLTLGDTFVCTLFFIFGLGLLILDGQRYIAEIKYSKGVSEVTVGNIDKGIKSLEGAVSMNPKSDLYLSQLSQAYILKLTSIINDKNLPDDEKNQKAQLLINNSINASKIATDVNPQNVSNWSIRGYVYQSLVGLIPNSEDWAIKSYDEAIKLEPTNPYYPTQQGIVYMIKSSTVDKDDVTKKNQDLDYAKAQFDKAVQLKSDYATARFQTAMVYQAQGNTAEEVAALEEAKKYSPNDVGLLFQIGLVYYQEADYEKAKSNLEAALSVSPDYANALYFLGLTYSKLGQVDKSIEKFQRVLTLNPDNAEVQKILDNLKSGKRPLDGIAEEDIPEAPLEETPEEKLVK